MGKDNEEKDAPVRPSVGGADDVQPFMPLLGRVLVLTGGGLDPLLAAAPLSRYFNL